MGKTVNRLMLCSGIHKREGWLTLDADPANHADFCETIPPIPQCLAAREWDEIEWVHGISSLYPWDGLEVLKGLRKIIKPDGVLILEQPDFNKLIQGERVNWFFGDPGPRNPLIMNRWAYTSFTLGAMLQESGFTRCQPMEAQHHVPSRDFRIEARP